MRGWGNFVTVVDCMEELVDVLACGYDTPEEFRTCTDLVDYLVLMLAFQSRKPQGFAIPNRNDIFWTFGAIDRLVERNQLVYQGPVKGDIVVSMALCVE